MSGGGLTTVETARRFPVRLVESGPAGGAILAADRRAREMRARQGRCPSTWAAPRPRSACIDDGEPQHSRQLRGGARLPLPEGQRPAAAHPGDRDGRDRRRRRLDRRASMRWAASRSGPKAPAPSPGPACYGRGGTEPTVTDADSVLGRIDPGASPAARSRSIADKAGAAVDKAVGTPLGLTRLDAAFGVSEIVDENMANAARVHAVESGKELPSRTHDRLRRRRAAACRAARREARHRPRHGAGRRRRRLGRRLPARAGRLRGRAHAATSGSTTLRRQDCVNALFAAMRAEAEAVVAAGAPDATLVETRTADMRYRGQGHEIAVPLPDRRVRPRRRAPSCVAALRGELRRDLRPRPFPGSSVEIMNWTLRLAAEQAAAASPPPQPADRPRHSRAAAARGLRPGRSGHAGRAGLSSRTTSRPAASLAGPGADRRGRDHDRRAAGLRRAHQRRSAPIVLEKV